MLSRDELKARYGDAEGSKYFDALVKAGLAEDDSTVGMQIADEGSPVPRRPVDLIGKAAFPGAARQPTGDARLRVMNAVNRAFWDKRGRK